MYEQVKEFLVYAGYKKFNSSSFITVRNDMLFTVSPQGVKNDINVWYSIYPLAFPGLWINMGWTPAAGSFPQRGSISYDSNLEQNLIAEIEQEIFPLFEKCKTLNNLEQLFRRGNFRSKYPRIFTLLAMGKYKEGKQALDELIEAFNTEMWGLVEKDIVRTYANIETNMQIDAALENERMKNIKKHNLVRFLKNANK